MDNPQTDQRLLERVAAGDRAALGLLAERYETGLLGMALGLLNGRHDLAKDAVQDCWLRALRSAGQFENRSGVKAWLYRILINRCHDLRDRAAMGPTLEVPADRAALGQSPAWTLEERERLSTLRRTIETLSPEHRLLVLLCYQSGMTHEQAAEVIGIPLGTLKSRLHAALSMLRERLGEVPKGGRR